MTMDLDENAKANLKKKSDAILKFGKIYEDDPYVLTLFYVISSLESAIDALRIEENDKDTEDDLREIINRLTKEVGVRIVLYYKEETSITMKDLGI